MNQLRLALRQLKRRPGSSAVIIMMLAFGIGATTAMFSLYHQILVRPLPVPEPERLVNLAAPGPGKFGGNYRDIAIGDPEAQFSYPMFRDLEAAHASFTGIAGHTDVVVSMRYRDDAPVYGRGALVSGSYFDTLNLRPALGRLLTRQDDPQIGESLVVVLSYDYWRRRFASDPNAIGQTLIVNSYSLEIVGVAPAGFTGTILGTQMEVFMPLTLRWIMIPSVGQYTPNRFSYWVYAFGRLAPRVTSEQAAAQLNGLYRGILAEEVPLLRGVPADGIALFRERQITLANGAHGQGKLRASAMRPLELLLGVTALVMLIVCVNVANLLLVRGATRAAELAVRTSLGASRGRLVAQLLTESFVFVAIGGLASFVVAALIVWLIAAMLPFDMSLGLTVLDPAAMLFAAVASVVTVLAFGLLPAWRNSDATLAQMLNRHASRSLGGRGVARFRAALSTAQIAFSIVLLVLAGLCVRSLMNVTRENLGIDVDSLVAFSITPRLNAYDQARIAALSDQVEQTLAAQPGVTGASITAIPILYDMSLSSSFSVEGFEAAPGTDTSGVWAAVGSTFFSTVGMPLLLGRAFTDRDAGNAPTVAIVNQTFAKKFNLGDEPIGKRFGLGSTTNFSIEVVGLVADAKYLSVKGDTPPVVYFPRRQLSGVFQSLWVYVRSSVGPERVRAMVPRVMREIDPNVPVATIQTLRERVNDNVYLDRLMSLLSTAFAGLATLLAGVGLYGVLSYTVAQRTREIGLRLALGATPQHLQLMVLKQVAVMAVIGMAIGLACAVALGTAAEAVLFGLSGRDPIVFATAFAVVVTVVSAASWLPARRASRIAPLDALRNE